MTSYCIAHNSPHPTKPDLCWRVRVRSLVDRAETPDSSGDCVWVPVLPAWTPDTVRMLFHELAVYVPSDPHATVGVIARLARRHGRPARTPKPARFDNRVEFWIEARGWRADVETWLDDRTTLGECHMHEWAEPMQAVLLDLAARSPLALSAITPVDAAYGCDLNIKPSRRNVAKGLEWAVEEAGDAR